MVAAAVVVGFGVVVARVVLFCFAVLKLFVGLVCVVVVFDFVVFDVAVSLRLVAVGEMEMGM